MAESIIIDNVNVAECEYWSGSKLGYCNIGLWANDGTHICECESNCYFKQLQRAKQKIERLENLLIKRLNAYQNQKKKLEQISEIIKEYQFCQQLIDIKNIIKRSANE